MKFTPYKGLRVVDLTDVWAGPMAASFLGDLGADVIRVESSSRPAILRPTASTPTMKGFLDDDPSAQPLWERSIRNYTPNRDKRGIALDLKEPAGREILDRLIARADVLLESYASGVVEKLGFGWERISNLNPRLIMISMSGWGDGGPYHGYRTMGSGIDATTGHVHLRGYRDTDVTRTVQAYQSDAAAASAALFAVGVSLRQRKRTGRGSWVDMAQAEVLMAHMPTPFLAEAYGLAEATPLENQHPVHVPFNCYPCQGEDRWIQICVQSQEQWLALCEVLAPSLRDDPRFGSPEARLANRGAVDLAVADLTRGRDSLELQNELQSTGVPAGAVYNQAQVANDRHLNARGFFERRPHSIAGERVYPGFSWRVDGEYDRAERSSNLLGEHNREVLLELGYSPAETDQLSASRVIGDSFQHLMVQED